jgi:3-isopropylmalate dehydrogenase
MANFKIAVLPGDGIGVEVTREAVKVLQHVSKKYGHNFELKEGIIGGIAIDKTGNPLPEETVATCKAADAVMLGAVGGPKWDNLGSGTRPEVGLLGIRKALGLYANLRPAIVYKTLKDASPLAPRVIESGLDILVVRELTGGMYFGKKGRFNDPVLGECAYDTEVYSVSEVKRIAKLGFESAMKRKKRLVSVDKANVLESSRLWRSVVLEVAKDYPEVELSHMYVDNASMQLVKNPGYFDVIVTSNMFGDILSDEASIITGSIGMLPSASLGDGGIGLYEPVHGSAPDIAGKNIANPLATILSVAMMLRYSLNLPGEADSIEKAVNAALDAGYRTPDIYVDGCIKVSTEEMGNKIVELA